MSRPGSGAAGVLIVGSAAAALAGSSRTSSPTAASLDTRTPFTYNEIPSE